MNTAMIKNQIIEKINTLSESQLNSVLSFVEKLENNQDIQKARTDEERQALAGKFKELCQDTQALFADNPISEEEIQAEIDAYRRGG
jgi:hypothetical protein